MKNEIEKAFEDKFYCPAKFAQEIEQMVQMHEDMNYIDAIVSFCEINSIDVQSVPKLISKPLKEKMINFFRNKKILITGGTGSFGNKFVKQLLKNIIQKK